MKPFDSIEVPHQESDMISKKQCCCNLKAYSLLEVQVALIVLMAGMLGLCAMLRIHSRQIEAAESWCREDIEYYMVSQSNAWMRVLGAPAELHTEPGVAAWTPPVTGNRAYEVLLNSFVLDTENRQASADLELEEIEEPEEDDRPGRGRR
jgi:hypothetical protein